MRGQPTSPYSYSAHGSSPPEILTVELQRFGNIHRAGGLDRQRQGVAAPDKSYDLLHKVTQHVSSTSSPSDLSHSLQMQGQVAEIIYNHDPSLSKAEVEALSEKDPERAPAKEPLEPESNIVTVLILGQKGDRILLPKGVMALRCPRHRRSSSSQDPH